MADGHFSDVELLRRELATLILEWAGKSVKDDPDGVMSTALTRAVGEAAREAVTEQHQLLTADAADRIAEALERRGRTGASFPWPTPLWNFGLVAAAAAALLLFGFVLGMQVSRTEAAAPATSAAAAATPIAPLVPAVDEPAPSSPARSDPEPPPAAKPQRATPSRTPPASRAPPRELGRPAPAGDEAAPRSTQPVGGGPSVPAETPTS